MSLQTLKKVSSFLKLLLNTTKDQTKALFYTLTPLQVAAICEIIFNLEHLPLPARVVREIAKRKHLFVKLIDKKTSAKRKLELLQNHYKQIQNTLNLLKRELLELLE